MVKRVPESSAGVIVSAERSPRYTPCLTSIRLFVVNVSVLIGFENTTVTKSRAAYSITPSGTPSNATTSGTSDGLAVR